MLKTGYGRVVITPDVENCPVPLDGMGRQDIRISNAVALDLEATAVAISDGENAVVLISVDTLFIEGDFGDRVRAEISERLSIPTENVTVAATHTHCGVQMSSKSPNVLRWIDETVPKIVHAAEDAFSDLKETELFGATVKAEHLNFVRRYEYNDGQITSAVSTGRVNRSGAKAHESRVDDEMHLLKFKRKGARDILLVNFRTHPNGDDDMSHGVYAVSPQTFGYVRRAFEEKHPDVDYVYFNGAAGNVSNTSQIPGEKDFKDGKEYTKAFLSCIENGIKEQRLLKTGKIKTASGFCPVPVDHSKKDLYETAKEMRAFYRADASENHSAFFKLCDRNGIKSIQECVRIMRNEDQLGDTEFAKLYLSAVSVGDVVFATVPYEMFDSNGMQVKAASPFAMTLILSNANGHWRYIASETGYKNGGFEPESGYFSSGAGELLAGELSKLVNKVK